MKRTTIVAFAIAIALVTAAAPAVPAAAVDEVVAKHIEAKGGLDAWNAIRSMRVTGEFTAFSKTAPFTLHRMRDDRYHMDHVMNGRRVVIGYDGARPWWDNEFFGPGARDIEGVDLTALSREFDFATPFFDIERLGHQVELVGASEYEGMPAIELKLTRTDGTSERWFLDPDTYLEMARISPGSDFGNPQEQRTVFDDFREVDGVRIPHFTESQWYTRDRVLAIDAIETNVEIDEAMFRVPAPPGMGDFLAMAGTWKVASSWRNSPQEPLQEGAREATVESALGGVLLREPFVSVDGEPREWTLSYDRYAERYRMTWISRTNGQLAVLEGVRGEDGSLTFDNVETGTTYETFGYTIYTRCTIVPPSDDGFEIRVEAAIGGDELNWFEISKETYTRSNGDGS